MATYKFIIEMEFVDETLEYRGVPVGKDIEADVGLDINGVEIINDLIVLSVERID